MSESESPAEAGLIVADTVVVNYFVAVGEFHLLRQLLGGRVHVPRAVFDSDEPQNVAEGAASELRRGLRLHTRRAGDRGVGKELRERSSRALPHFEQLTDHASRGEIVALKLTTAELQLYAQLRDRQFVAQHARIAGLGHGEAAALAIALGRGYSLATDDQDAIVVAQALSPGIGIHRIRGLLTRAAEEGVIDMNQAQSIHTAMIRAGFWDSESIG